MESEREEIEAELHTGEHKRAIAGLKQLTADVEEFERNLRWLEAELVMPEFFRSKPLAQRLAYVGISKEAIAQVNMLFETIETCNRLDEWPEAMKQFLAKIADVEYSTSAQLAELLESRRKA